MQFLEWDSANVILIQAFWGPFDDGHFSSLILDRTRKGNPLAVYAYSLREYKPDAINKHGLENGGLLAETEVETFHRFNLLPLKFKILVWRSSVYWGVSI